MLPHKEIKRDGTPFQWPRERKFKNSIGHLVNIEKKKNNHLKKHKIKNEKMEVRTNIWDNRVCKWEIFGWGESTLGYRDEDFLSKVAERQGEGGSDMCQQKTKQGFHSNTTKPVEFKV